MKTLPSQVPYPRSPGDGVALPEQVVPHVAARCVRRAHPGPAGRRPGRDRAGTTGASVSRLAAWCAPPAAKRPDLPAAGQGPFGAGWQFNIEQLIHIDADSGGPAGMLRIDGDGRRRFTRSSAAAATAARWVTTATLTGNENGTAIYRTPTGDETLFNGNGQETEWHMRRYRRVRPPSLQRERHAGQLHHARATVALSETADTFSA